MLLATACAVLVEENRQMSTPKPTKTLETAPEPGGAAFGSWPSPISAAKLAQASVAMSDLRSHQGALYWRESRPAEQGRQLLMRRSASGLVETLTPAGFNVRTRVHEYGGNAYLVTDDAVVFANFSDQRLYWQRFSGDQTPVAITPTGFQFADGVFDPLSQRMIWVREDHREATKAQQGEERNEIVALALPTDDASAARSASADLAQVLVSDSDFVAFPRINGRGDLAWIEWNHPDMPWDRTKLKLASFRGGALSDIRTLVDAPNIAALEPSFDREGRLYFVAESADSQTTSAEASDWWNLQRWQNDAAFSVHPMQRELAGPLWNLGGASYLLTSDNQAVIRSSYAALDELGVIDLRSGKYRSFELPFAVFSELQRLDDAHVVALAQSAKDTAVLIEITLATGAWRVLHQPTKNEIPEAFIAVAQAIDFPTTPGPDGSKRQAHAWFYRPTNPHVRGPAEALPPLIVTIHGGPTSVARPTLNLARQYWTSRGFALVDVNYGGSTSFGRAYRQRLNGQWGIVDVADAIAAVDFLVASGQVDPNRVAIRGGSAGGFTTLAALAFHDRFKAGANLYGVADIAALAATSHKFERHYDVSLVGPPDAERYRARSPLFHLEGFSEPLITFQGSEDKVVPPSQSRMIVDALDERGVPHAYIEFAGEQHGFRQASNIIRAQEAELYFYGQIFGFEPADQIAPVEIKHWPKR